MTGLRIGSLFSGYQGLDMAVEQVTGAKTVWVSDIDKGANKILAHNSPDIPNLGDITAINWADVEPVDILTGGFPCQDLSHAGKRAGLKEGTRSGLWTVMAQAINNLRPRLVVAENVRGLLSAAAPSVVEPCAWCVGDGPTTDLRALGVVLADLADLGYDAQWVGLRASDVGAPHERFRVFLIAYPEGHPWRLSNGDGGDAADTARVGRGEGWPESEGILGRLDAALGGGADVALLPTPNPFHAGNTESPDEWRERRADVFERTGTRHGPALSVIAQSIADGDPLTKDRYMPDRLLPTPMTDPDSANGHGRHLGKEAKLLPTPTTQDGANDGGPSQFERNTPPLNTAVKMLPTPMVGSTAPSAHGQISGQFRDQMDAALARFGDYAPAIARWEIVTGRTSPEPTEPTGKDGAQRLSPRFVEWMMGLPEGWVTDVPGITRNQALKALGNGVVPQQATAALHHMLGQRVAA